VDVVGTGPLRVALARSDALSSRRSPTRRTRSSAWATATSPPAVLIRNRTGASRLRQDIAVEAPIVIGIVRGIVGDFNLRAAHAKLTVGLRAEPVEAQSLDYVDLLVPGLLAMANRPECRVSASLLARRVAQKGMLRRLRLTPLPLVEFATARVVFHS